MLRHSVPLLALLAAAGPLLADEAKPGSASPPPKSVVELLATHDRSLLADLKAYIASHPKAEDLDQAYMNLFERAIEHDWFAECEAEAKGYLAQYPDGAVQPLARIVATMARSQAGRFDEALASFKELIGGLDKDEHEEFAGTFTDSLANAATTAGEYQVAREVYETLLKRFNRSPALREKVKDDLARLDMIGKPAPVTVVRDLKGETFRLSDLKGKYVLIDFWATWCAPCVAEMPNLLAAYETYHGKGFEVVGVSLDETAEPLVDFVKARKIPWTQIHEKTCGGDVLASYGVSNIPCTFLIGPDGTIAHIELRGKSLQSRLASLLK